MTTRAEQLVAEAEERLKEAKELLRAEREKSAVKGHPHVFVPHTNALFERIIQHNNDGVFVTRKNQHFNGEVKVAFRPEQAQRYADFLNVMFELMACEGADVAMNAAQHCVNAGGDVQCWYGFGHSKKERGVTAWFPTCELAEAARDRVGRDRIVTAYNALAEV